jgi:excisionase family DNA binding protein
MQTHVSPSPLITSSDAADRHGCSERMIRKLVRTRQVPFMRVGRLVRFRPEELDRYVETHSVAASDQGQEMAL